MTPSLATPPRIDRDALVRVVEPVVHAHGAELVNLELKTDRGGWVLRVYVEKAGAAAQALSTRDAAVNLELCANVSRDLSPALDVVDLIPHAYSLEVSSPGVERPLRAAADYVRFAGQKAKLRLRDPVDGQRVIIGILAGVADGKVQVAESGRTHQVPLASIDRARLVFELTAQRKQGGHQSQRKQSEKSKQRKH